MATPRKRVPPPLGLAERVARNEQQKARNAAKRAERDAQALLSARTARHQEAREQLELVERRREVWTYSVPWFARQTLAEKRQALLEQVARQTPPNPARPAPPPGSCLPRRIEVVAPIGRPRLLPTP